MGMFRPDCLYSVAGSQGANQISLEIQIHSPWLPAYTLRTRLQTPPLQRRPIHTVPAPIPILWFDSESACSLAATIAQSAEECLVERIKRPIRGLGFSRPAGIYIEYTCRTDFCSSRYLKGKRCMILHSCGVTSTHAHTDTFSHRRIGWRTRADDTRHQQSHQIPSPELQVRSPSGRKSPQAKELSLCQ